jgi:hypothetical protein
MIKSPARVLLVAALFSCNVSAHADEATFLKSLDGDWSGNGTVKVRVNSSPMSVSCKFSSDTTEKSLSLDGSCTGMVVFSRAISADLVTKGSAYSGSYVGAGTGPAGLNGRRSGNSINLGIRWAKEVNGDRKARMTIEKVGDDGMRLITVDTDPDTGRNIVTSKIDLRRS